MNFLDQKIEPLGMGCWPIGGAMFHGTQSLGYHGADDAEAFRTIHAALDAGITLFDTAAAYGAGHSERLLAKALKDRPDALIVTKIGIGIDEETKQLNFDLSPASDIMGQIDACLTRLERDRIDILLWHPNDTALEDAEPIFAEIARAHEAGKLRAFGWSTDFTDKAAHFAGLDGFAAVEHAMNIFIDAPRIQRLTWERGLTALLRSPLAMGLLGGKYDANVSLPKGDIRASQEPWMKYFNDGRANPDFLAKLDAVRDLLTTGGRSLAQGALCWLWAKGPQNIPIPGARTVAQIEGLAGALAFGPLPQDVMAEIETLIPRDPDAPDEPN